MAAGPRLTGPATKLARSITTTATASQSNTLLTSTKSTTAPLSRKYAELLKERNIDPDHPRHLYTRSSNRPHPPPRTMRLMQSFTSSAPTKAALANTASIDNIVFPGSASLDGWRDDPWTQVRAPLLPDSFAAHHAPDVADGPVAPAQISIVAANPELVSPSALTEVEGMGVDGVELKFAHEETPSEQSEQGTLTDIWKGLVDDVLGSSSRSKTNTAL